MQFLLLGIVFGSLTIIMPGPISVSLVQVATTQGRASGVRAAAGIASGDVVLGTAALFVVSLGAALPHGVFSMLQVATGALLLAFGLMLFTRPAVVGDTATLSAMPFAADRPSLLAFALGMLLVSIVWHPLVGACAGVIGPRLTPTAIQVGTRIGGLATIALGIWSLLG